MIRTLTKREQLIFIICVVTIAAYLMITIGKFLIGQLSSSDQRLLVAKRNLAKEARLVQKGVAIDATYRQYIKWFQPSVSEEETASGLIAEIERAAVQAGVHVSELKPKGFARQGILSEFRVILVFNASLEKSLEFLSTMQQQPYYFAVEEFELTRQGGRETSDLSGSFLLSKTYVGKH